MNADSPIAQNSNDDFLEIGPAVGLASGRARHVNSCSPMESFLTNSDESFFESPIANWARNFGLSNQICYDRPLVVQAAIGMNELDRTQSKVVTETTKVPFAVCRASVRPKSGNSPGVVATP